MNSAFHLFNVHQFCQLPRQGINYPTGNLLKSFVSDKVLSLVNLQLNLIKNIPLGDVNKFFPTSNDMHYNTNYTNTNTQHHW